MKTFCRIILNLGFILGFTVIGASFASFIIELFGDFSWQVHLGGAILIFSQLAAMVAWGWKNE